MSRAFGLPEKIVIWDVEITSWEGAHARGWSRESEHREIIQVGAIMVDTERLAEIASLEMFVKPKVNPKLSNYIQELTKITQAEVDMGVEPGWAINLLLAFGEGSTFYSWGDIDRKAIEETASLNDVALSDTETRFLSIRPLFRAYGIDTNAYMSSTIVEAFGKKPTRQGHSGLNDARTILDALRELAKR